MTHATDTTSATLPGRRPRGRAALRVVSLTLLILLGGLLLIALSGLAVVDWPKRPFRPPDSLQVPPGGFTLLTVNVGNSALACRQHSWKLCKTEVERKLAENLRLLEPDLVALQEILPAWLCQAVPTGRANHVCRDFSPDDPPQARRLLGPDYTIVCDERGGFECLGVRMDFAEVVGCPPGGFCTSDRIDRHLEGCDLAFSIMGATLRLDGRALEFVDAHPQARDAPCRAYSLQQLFGEVEGAPILPAGEPALLAGDLNLDPWRFDDESVAVWQRYVGDAGERPYAYLSGPAEHDPPYPTWLLSWLRYTLDHVVSNALQGRCVVLGVTPGTNRLDGELGGLDHRGIYCVLTFLSQEAE